MGQPDVAGIDSVAAQAFLAAHFDAAAADVEPLGAGAWSRAFGFRRGAEELVVRFGRHADDFAKDRWAHAYRRPDLPIPAVLALGPAFDGFYAVSTRARGEALEHLKPAAWRAVVPALAAALEALRLADLAGTRGYGGWDGSGHAPYTSWSAYLLAVGDDPPGRRTHGWRRRLATSPAGEAAFAWGYERLRQVLDDTAPRSLVHADLINRNVLVAGERLSAVFDWGCAAFGDHLYDLAWLEFWAPWHPNLDVPLLRAALERRWGAAGYAPQNPGGRLAACCLHIGLDHLAYNAYLGDWAALAATAERMRALAGGPVV